MASKAVQGVAGITTKAVVRSRRARGEARAGAISSRPGRTGPPRAALTGSSKDATLDSAVKAGPLATRLLGAGPAATAPA